MPFAVLHRPRRGGSVLPSRSHGRRLLAVLLATLAVLVGNLGAATLPALPASAMTGALAVPMGASTDGDFTVTKTASVSQLPFGGGPVTYTYTVTNATGGRQYYVSGSDDKCSPIDTVSGMTTFYDAISLRNFSYIPAGGTATFRCTAQITQDTTNTASFVFANGYTYDYLFLVPVPGSYNWQGRSTGTAQATVTVARPPAGSVVGCDGLWYINDSLTTGSGQIGTITTANGSVAQTRRAYTAHGGATNSLGGGAAVAADPTNPARIYYIERNMDVSGGSLVVTGDYALYVYDQSTGTHTLLVGSSTPDLVRLGVDASGVLWAIDGTGVVYSYTPGATAWANRGTITLSDGRSMSSLGSGDIAFDGNGNMWFIGSESPSNGQIAYLYTITAAELAAGGSITGDLVGSMGAGSFGGLAFGPDGTLYAEGVTNPTLSSRYSTLWVVNKETGSTTRLTPDVTGVMMSDLGSCALPKSQLRATKTVTPAVVAAGGTLTYTITIENIGNLAATNVKLVDPVPAGTTYVAGSAQLNGTQVSTSATFPYAAAREVHDPSTSLAGVIGAGKTATVTFQVKVADGTTGQVCNTGTATYNSAGGTIATDDPNQPGAADATCSTVLTPAIDLTKKGSTSVLNADGSPTPVTYTYTVKNPGTEPLKDVSVTDDKCSPVSYQSGDANGDAVLTNDETWTYTCTATLTVETLNTATTRGTGVLTAKVVTDTDTWVVKPPPLSIVKTSSPNGQPVNVGDVITYTVKVKNTGTVNQSDVTLDDVLPAGVTYVAGSAQKTYSYDQTTPGTATGSYVATLPAFGFEPASPDNQTFTIPSLPAGAQLASYAVTMNGSSANDTGCGGIFQPACAHAQRDDVSVSATLPGGGAWFTVPTPSFGAASPGTWTAVSRSGSISGPAAGTFTLAWSDNADQATDPGPENTANVSVTINYSYPTSTTTRSIKTDAANPPPALVGTGDHITLLPGEEMTVTFQAKVNANSPATLKNTATADSNESTPVSDDVTDTVRLPSLDAVKTAGTLTGPDADGVYRATYQVTVTNSGLGTGSYGPLTDTVGFDPDLTPTAISWTGQTTGSVTFAGAPYTAVLAPASTSIAPGATHTYAVTVAFTHTGPGGVGGCADDTPGRGLYNAVAFPQPDTAPGNNDACVPPSTRFAVRKAVQGSPAGTTGPAATVAPDGTVTVTYEVSVSNTGLASGTSAAVHDTVAAPTGFTVTSVTVDGTAQTPATASFTLPATTLAAKETKTYTVVVTLTAADLSSVDWAEAGTCTTTGAGTPTDGGAFNTVVMAGDTDIAGPDNNDACVPLEAPTATITVHKLAEHCDVSLPTCPLAGARFALYDVDPATAGATPIVGGDPMALDPGTADGSRFTSPELDLYTDYWLVETRAPSGFLLLADPVRFSVTGSGIDLTDPAGSPGVTVVGSDDLELRVVDEPGGRLPDAGGPGPWPAGLLGLALLLAGAALQRPLNPRTPGRHAVT